MSGPRIGSICSGYAGLDLAVESVLGGEVAWVADNDPGACKILAHRFPGVPNHGDITTADWGSAEPVDILTAGFPCQPVSAAGRRKGISDERWLFDDITEALGRMVARPRLLVLENVAGLLSANGGHAMARVVHGLAALGYVGRYRLLRASDVGAPHKRERWFCVAWPADAAGDRRSPEAERVKGGGGAQAGQRQASRATGSGGPEPAADPGSDQPERERVAGVLAGTARGAEGDGRERQRDGDAARGGGADAADTDGRGQSPHQPGSFGAEGSEAPGGRPATHRRGGSHPPEDPDRAAGGERRLPAPGQAPGGRPRADTGGPGGAPAPDAESHGRDEGRTEPARLVGRPDAAVSGDGLAADADSQDAGPHRGGSGSPAPAGALGGAGGRGEPGSGVGGGAAADAKSERHRHAGQARERGIPAAPLAGAPADAASERRTGRDGPQPLLEHDGPEPAHAGTYGRTWGAYEPAIRRWEAVLGRPAPRPTEPGRTGERLSPRFVEWMQGIPEGWVTDVPGLSRNQMLHALGNGVVPQQCAYALRLLLGAVEAGEAA